MDSYCAMCISRHGNSGVANQAVTIVNGTAVCADCVEIALKK